MQQSFMGDKVLGFQQIVGLAVSTGLTLPAGTESADVQVIAQAVSWRGDAIAPTAVIGMQIPAGTTITFDCSQSLAQLRFIELVASATLNITYYGR
jgi:hypothetical protein